MKPRSLRPVRLKTTTGEVDVQRFTPALFIVVYIAVVLLVCLYPLLHVWYKTTRRNYYVNTKTTTFSDFGYGDKDGYIDYTTNTTRQVRFHQRPELVAIHMSVLPWG